MRLFHSTITPAVIHAQARQVLQANLQWAPWRDSVSVPQLWDLLLLMAASGKSLFAVVRRFFPFSHETAQRAVNANLPSMERLIQAIVQSLHDTIQFSRKDRQRSWLLAIDTNYVPYYGKRNPFVVGGPKKQGTQWFYCFATAVLLHKHRRYTIAFAQLTSQTKPHEIVRMLLDQIVTKGLKIRGVALDSGFDSGETLLLLQERQLAYVVPLRRKGTSRTNARNRCFEGRHGQIRWVNWTTEKSRRPVRTRTLLWKGQARTMVFAFHGWTGDRAWNIHEQARHQQRLYRKRFGIETSYRQKNQAKAFTTSRNPVYRVLLEGMAYLLRQLWVVLTEALARSRNVGANQWMDELPMQKMLEWLIHALAALYPEELSIPLT